MPACIFCSIVAGAAPASVVWADEQVLAFLDIYPLRVGHVLVIPRTHAVRLSEVPSGTRAHLFAVAIEIGDALRAGSVPCDDVNIVVNDGRAANQTVPHVHVHVLPRRRGDLPRVLGALMRRPLAPLLDARGRPALDTDAAEIRRHLDGQRLAAD